MKKPPVTAPRLLPEGGTALILCSGPSICATDVALARAHADLVICVNDAFAFASDATCLFAADARWWTNHGGCVKPHTYQGYKFPAFTGTYRYGIRSIVGGTFPPGINAFAQGPQTGLSLDPTKLATGKNSGYMALNLAIHFGATRVVYLGLDMKQGKRFRDGAWRPSAHFFGHLHVDGSEPPYQVCINRFHTTIGPLKKLGVEVINCTPDSALTCFRRASLQDVWPIDGVAATG